MQNQSDYDQNDRQSWGRIQENLFELILDEDPVYPWNPSEAEAEAYFAELLGESGFNEWLDEEDVPQRSEKFFAVLAQCWEPSATETVEVALVKKFGNLVPADLLRRIATVASQVVTANLSGVEQLVESVKPVLSHWAEEDLEVFARPLAYAMRSKTYSDAIALPKSQVEVWEQLSPVEQAKYVMAIANYALIQLQE